MLKVLLIVLLGSSFTYLKVFNLLMPIECYDLFLNDEIAKSKYISSKLNESEENVKQKSIIVGDSDIMLALDPRVLGKDWLAFTRGGTDLEREYYFHKMLKEKKYKNIIYGFNLSLTHYVTSGEVTHFDRDLITGMIEYKELIEMVVNSLFFSFKKKIMIRDSFQRILLGILSKFFIGVNYIRDTIKNKTFFRLPFLDLPARRCGNRSFLHENIENYSKQQGYRFSTEENALVPKIAEEEEYLFDNIESLNVRSYLITPMLENLMNMSECLFITVPPKIKTDNNKVYYESVKKYKKYLNPIISKYKNVKFLETDWLYPYYNFSDAHHMNLAGAQKFTQNLKEIIQNTDCKSN